MLGAASLTGGIFLHLVEHLLVSCQSTAVSQQCIDILQRTLRLIQLTTETL